MDEHFRFIQAQSASECEALMNDIGAAFVSCDHRIYEHIEFWDKDCMWEIPAKTILRLYELQSQIDWMSDGGCENPFTDVSRAAIELEKLFAAAVAQTKADPIRKKVK